MTRILKHDNVVISQTWEAFVVEGGVVKDLSLKRFGAVEHEASALEHLIEFWKAVYVLLVFVDRLEIDLERPIRIEIEKERRLQN